MPWVTVIYIVGGDVMKIGGIFLKSQTFISSETLILVVTKKKKNQTSKPKPHNPVVNFRKN